MKTKKIQIRVSPDDYAAIKEKATSVGLSQSEFLRRAALQIQLPPPPAPQINRELFVAMSSTMANLNQIARRLNIDYLGYSSPSASDDDESEIRAELGQLYRFLEQLRWDLVRDSKGAAI